MTKDDIETYEARIGDRLLFNNIALILLSACIPLGIEKFIEYQSAQNGPAMAIIIVCVVGTVAGSMAALVAHKRHRKVETFKATIFRQERKIASMVMMFDGNDASQSSTPKHVAVGSTQSS